MQGTDWRLSGDWIKNCNCAFGCPCDFNAPPTHGNCQAVAGMRIERGHFGGTPLDGLSFLVVAEFPGPLHEGNGTLQAIVDERASPEQRDALFQILSGKHAAEGTNAGSDIHASKAYREHLARVLTRRALEEAAARV